jgi:lipid A 4'-phosphatase
MNGTGLAIALAVAIVVGGLFALDPRLDVALAALFFDPGTHRFSVVSPVALQHARDAARWLITLLAAPAVLAVLGKVIVPRRRMLVGGRASVFLIGTLAIGPGIVANVVFKDHWSRPRPAAVTQFGGPSRFMPWWDPRGNCPNNCSFVAGEPSGAFWTMAPASLAPPQWRPLAYGAALGFGAVIGAVRMAGGGHFFSDVVFAGVFVFLVIWAVHGLLYRWPRTRTTDEAVERRLGRCGQAIRDGLARLLPGGTRPS